MRLDLTYFCPEGLLVGTILFRFLLDFLGERGKRFFPWVASIGLLGMMAATRATDHLPASHFFLHSLFLLLLPL